MGEPAGPGANQATGPPGFNGHRRKGPGGAAPLYRGPRWRDEARRGRAVSAGASFGSSAASPYTTKPTKRTRGAGASPCARPATRAANLTEEAGPSTTLRPEGEQHRQRVNTAREVPNRAPGRDSPISAPGGARPQACQHLTLPHCRTGKQQLGTTQGGATRSS